MLIVTTGEHSYFIEKENLLTVELGSSVFDSEENKMYLLLEPGVLTEVSKEVLEVSELQELVDAIAAGGNVNVKEDIDAPTGFVITVDTTVINDSELSIAEDTAGDGVFKITDGTLTLEGKGTINGVGKNDWSMAIWATDNGKVVINDGYFTNVGAETENDPEHFDLIYASGNGQIEINGGEFKCQTPKWTLNIKDKDRATAAIVVKGGKFHNFDPSNCDVEGPNTNFVAEGYKVVETNGIFEVVPE
jgi:hypothetical protein